MQQRPPVSPSRLPSGAIDRLVISFASQGGKSYRIEESVDMKTWRALESNITGNGNTIERSFPAREIKAFLRAGEQ